MPAEVRAGSVGLDVWKGCLTKLRFTSAGAARSFAKTHRKMHPGRPRHRIYQCSFCDHWHLTKAAANRDPDVITGG